MIANVQGCFPTNFQIKSIKFIVFCLPALAQSLLYLVMIPSVRREKIRDMLIGLLISGSQKIALDITFTGNLPKKLRSITCHSSLEYHASYPAYKDIAAINLIPWQGARLGKQ